MRIWIINHYAIPPSSPGGTRHYNLARMLQNLGHEVLIIAANYNHLTHTFMVPPDKCNMPDFTYPVPFLWLSASKYKGNTIARFWNMLVFMRAILKNPFLRKTSPPDVIIGSSPHLFAALGAQKLAKKLKCAFILEIRDLWPESLVDLGRFKHSHPLIRIMKRIERRLYQNADKIISLLPSANEYLILHGVKENNILWLPNSIDPHTVPKNLTPPKNEKFTVMSAGAHGVANDLDTVLDAAKILQQQGLDKKIRILLIGDGPEKPRLKKLAETHNITLVEFLDAVPKNRIYQTLNKADAYMMLLKKSPVFRWGISPNKLFDYLVMGRPILFGVETPFNPVEKYNIGLTIKASDPQSLANAIYKLSLMPKEQLDAMGARGKEYVLKNHDVEKLADSLNDLIQNLRPKVAIQTETETLTEA